MIQPSERLLRTIVEELKVPLIRIARQAELGEGFDQIGQSADGALKLLDSFLISTQFYNSQLALEPVPLAATLYDVADQLNALAKLQDCRLELDIGKDSGIAMAHPQALRAAFIGLGYSFLHALDASVRQQRVVFSAHKTKNGIRAGVFSPQAHIAESTLRTGRALYGKARRPVADATYSSGAGFFVADSLFFAMASKLKPARLHGAHGLAGVFVPSTQLALL